MTPTRAEARAKVAAARDVLANLNHLDDMLQRYAPETPPGPSGGAR